LHEILYTKNTWKSVGLLNLQTPVGNASTHTPLGSAQNVGSAPLSSDALPTPRKDYCSCSAELSGNFDSIGQWNFPSSAFPQNESCDSCNHRYLFLVLSTSL